MAGRLLQQVVVAALVAGAPTGAAAAVPAARVNGGADDRGVTVHVIDGSPGGRSTRTGRPSRPTGGCRRRLVAAEEPVFLRGSRPPMPPRPSPEHRAFHVYCASRYVTSVWRVPSPGGLRELLARVEFPDLTIRSNPATGLTGLATWFWIDGYDGRPLEERRAAPGITVDIEVRAGTLTWDFGDGTVVHAGFGQRYPRPSDVRHTYERRGTYTVTVRYGFHARYRVNGAAWTALDTVQLVASRTYRVREVRSVLTGT